MRMLWDRHPELPYVAHAPWPIVMRGDNFDWEGSVNLVDDWLRSRVGPRWVEWTWGWATFSMYDLNWRFCTVNFNRASNCSLFLLQFGCDIDNNQYN